MRKLIFLPLLFLMPAFAEGKGLESQVKTFQLKNGMRWLLIHRPKVPVFSGVVMVGVGGVDEPSGKSGLAHMFEHMAFKGSKKIGTKNYAAEIPILQVIAQAGQELTTEELKENPDPKTTELLRKKIEDLRKKEAAFILQNDVMEQLDRAGGNDLNAFTSKDVTAYHVSLPQEAFSKWAFIFSEMIFHPILREFYQERDVVMEERRLRYDNNPYGHMMEKLIETAFPEGPYHTMAIGSPKDIRSLTMEDADSFHQAHYASGNVVGVLVGAISEKEAKPILEKTFGRIPAGKKTPPIPNRSFAFQGLRRVVVPFDAASNLGVAFYKPSPPAKEDYIFDVLHGLLCEGRTGLLYREFVEEKKWVSQVQCGNGWPGSRQDNLFLILMPPNRGRSLQKVEEALFAFLANLENKITDEGIQKIRQSALHDHYQSMKDNMDLATALADAETLLSDWHYLTRYVDQIRSVTREEVLEVGKKYFVSNNAVVVHRVEKK